MEQRKIQRSSDIGNDNVRQADLIRDRLEAALRLVDEMAGTRAPQPAPQHQPLTENMVRSLIRHRRNRSHFFEESLFADPAWDILLDLFAAELSQQRVTVTSLCSASAVPSTTALRWIAVLEGKGLIAKRQDPMDARRFFVSLTPQGLKAMQDYFRTLPSETAIV